jgi:hypothetical protein
MNEKDLINLLVAILIASITAYLAKRRGRSPMLWFFLGAFFGLFGLIALYLFPAKKDSEAAGEESGKENDEGRREIEVVPTQVTVASTDAEDQIPTESWFYLDSEHQQFGPVTLSQLKALFEEKKISTSSYVWQEGMQEWKKLGELPQLVATFTNSTETHS